jgi:hypothetical protein
MDDLVLLAPVLLLLIVVWFGFVGCGSFGTESQTAAKPDSQVEPPAIFVPVPTVTYREIVLNTPGLKALWPLDETSGNITSVVLPLGSPLIDVDGTYTQVGVTVGENVVGGVLQKGNRAPRFAGTNGRLDIKYNKQFNIDKALRFSVELWMKRDLASITSQQVLVSSRLAGNQSRGYDIILLLPPSVPQPTIRARVFAPGDTSNVDVLLTQGDPAAWRHIVSVYDGPTKTLTLYVSVVGLANPVVNVASNVNYEPIPEGGSTLRFAASHTQQAANAQNFFAGWLDEVAFYEGALTLKEVKDHFKKASGTQ